MAEIDFYYPFDSIDGDRKTTAATERRFFGALFTDGVVGADAFKAEQVGAGVYRIGPGVAIVKGAIGGIVNAKQVTAKPALGAVMHIVLRLDTTNGGRKVTLEAVASMESDSVEQLEQGGMHDLPLYAVEGTSGGYVLADKRAYCTSFDNAVYSQDFQALYDGARNDTEALLDALRVNIAAAMAEANADTAGLYGSVGRQGFMNPTFSVNQRGSSFYGAYTEKAYTYDRWRVDFEGANSNGTAYVQREQQGERLALSIDYKGFAGTAAAVASLTQCIEGGVRAFCAGGRKFTVSFDAKASAAARIAVEPTQYATAGGAGTALAAQSVNVTTEWQRFNLVFEGTLTPDVVSNFADVLKVAFCFGWRGHSARFGADQAQAVTFHLANMQINAGTQALPCYVRPYADELAACQRYYQRFEGVSLAAGATLAATNQVFTGPLPQPCRMYKAPKVTVADRADVQEAASVEIAAGGWRNGLACAVSDMSAHNPAFIVTNTDASAVTRVCFNAIELDAEIMD